MSDSRVHLLICWNVIIVISTALFVYTGRAIHLLFLGSVNIFFLGSVKMILLFGIAQYLMLVYGIN
jgi:hypothetical protein